MTKMWTNRPAFPKDSEKIFSRFHGAFPKDFLEDFHRDSGKKFSKYFRVKNTFSTGKNSDTVSEKKS